MIVTPHGLFGPRLVPVQVSAVLMRAEGPVTVIFSAEMAELPVLVKVNALARIAQARQ